MKFEWSLKKKNLIVWACHLCLLLTCSWLVIFPAALKAEELNVALFPWVPRLDQFKTMINETWSQCHPGVKLNFKEWDCYSEDPKPELDLFVFDAIFLSYFQEKGYLERISPEQVYNWDDILEFSRNGTRVGNDYYGIPQLACSNFFFCKDNEGDNGCSQCIGKPSSLDNICGYVGQRKNPGCIIPDTGDGLLMSLSGGTTCALLYLGAVEDLTGLYDPNPSLPKPKDALNENAIANLKKVLKMTGISQAKFSEIQAYQRAGWYSSGSGKALVHYSESTWRMWYLFRDSIFCKVMPLGPKPVNLFYIDIIGIKPNLQASKKYLALELANLITGTEMMVKCIKPWGNESDQSFQYLLPVRATVFEALCESDKTGLYKKFYTILQTCDPQVFRIGFSVRDWLNSGIKDNIKNAIFSPQGKIEK